MPLPLATRLGPYEILSSLGAGGMGEVYRARDTRLDRIVALKTLPSELARDEERRSRFEREARAISALSHPHICTLYDVGDHDGVQFLVMELLTGETLAARLERGALALDDVLRYAIQIADALDQAHRHGIVHRDLKPANIMITSSGVKLLDFGLAKQRVERGAVIEAATATERQLTAQGQILGTLQYMAPEQLEGQEADERTDLFAFGAIVHEMATGRPAFSGSSQASLIAEILKTPARPMREIAPVAPPALEQLIELCLAKNRADRWSTAHDVLLQLQGISSDSRAAFPTTVSEHRRWRAAWSAIAALAVLAVLGVMWQLRSSEPAAGLEV